MRNRFEKQLDTLHKELIIMGSLCEEAIEVAVKAIRNSDIHMAKTVKDIESRIDEKEREIEDICLKILLLQQPVAHDLREISAAMKMITDMERIGDQTLDIAEIVEFLNEQPTEDFEHIEKMAKATKTMVKNAIEAYVKKDISLVAEVLEQDDEVDEYFEKIKNAIIDMIKLNKIDGAYAVDLLMIIKYLERIGDHATNIAEWVQFAITGEHIEG